MVRLWFEDVFNVDFLSWFANYENLGLSRLWF